MIIKKKKFYKYNYPDNKTIGEKLRSGDKTEISSKTGFSLSYVVDVLKGRRDNKKIIDCAILILGNRNAFDKIMY